MATKVDRKLQKKWLAELVSRKYKQGKFQLRTDDNKFCCYGVLCNIVDKNVWKPYEKSSSGNYEWDGQDEIPPKYLLERVGIVPDEATDFLK